MIVKSMQLMNFRNISQQDIAFSSKFNLLYGENASGKTSLLEALHVLSMGKSFRSSQQQTLIQHNMRDFTLFSLIQDTQLATFSIGIQKNRENSCYLHMNGDRIRSIAEISKQFPVLFIGTDNHRILMDGPKVRRQLLDWGLFHVKQSFLSCWRDYQKILTHRNAALKARVSKAELSVWNEQLALLGEQLNTFRQLYLTEFMPHFKMVIEVFLEKAEISLQYERGWAEGESLLEAFEKGSMKELQMGHSLYGPHRADLVILSGEHLAEEVLSQGQQKLLSYALKLAQGVHLKAAIEKAPIFLIDDLPSELDVNNQQRVAEVLRKIDCQVFITGVERESLEIFAGERVLAEMFHVKHGVIEKENKALGLATKS